MSDWVGYLATVLAVIGVVLNNRMDRRCFIVWTVSNLICLWIHAGAEIWSLAIRDVVFTVLAVDGWRRWSGKVSK